MRMNRLALLATASNMLLATDPAAALGGTGLGTPAPAPTGDTPAPTGDAPATDPNTFVFRIPNTETDISIELGKIPAEVRMDLLKKGVRDYIVNSTNQENVRTNKANAPFDAHDEAVKADPLQTAVPKPAGERKVADLLGTAAAARNRLYSGEIRKQGEGTGTPRERVDPLVQMVTKAVVQEVMDKRKAAGTPIKLMDAQKLVGKNGVEYLDKLIAEKVAGGADKAALEKFKDERYIKPAQMMLGKRSTKATADENSIL